jgi:type VI secretion system protein ImpC
MEKDFKKGMIMSLQETASPIASTQTITKENIYQSLFEKFT